jgi:hypothetical protein
MVFVLLTYGGWNEAAYLSAEVRDGAVNMVRSLVLAMLIVTGLYLLVTWATGTASGCTRWRLAGARRRADAACLRAAAARRPSPCWWRWPPSPRSTPP